jgi:hypothetical protein
VVGKKKGKKKEREKKWSVGGGEKRIKKKKKKDVGDIQRNRGRWKRKMGKEGILEVEEIIKNK